MTRYTYDKDAKLKKLLTYNQEYLDRVQQMEAEAKKLLENQSVLAEHIQEEMRKRDKNKSRKRPIGALDGDAV